MDNYTPIGKSKSWGGGVGAGEDVIILKRLDKDLYELLFFQEN